jgi:two-component system, OmpR family, KDP operon response regulator KdpE
MSDVAARVLVVEDEPQMRRFLKTTLTSYGFDVLEADTAASGIALATSSPPDLVLLDLGLPDKDGLEVARRLREWSTVPILVLSARGRERDKVEALDLGADDYVTKPFGTGELLARIRVALRHAARSAPAMPDVLTLGDVSIDVGKREVRRNGELVHLTPTEYRLFLLLARNAGKLLTHRQILREVWGPSRLGQTEYLRVYMLQLRRKLEAHPERPQLLLTEPGVGYRVREPA